MFSVSPTLDLDAILLGLDDSAHAGHWQGIISGGSSIPAVPIDSSVAPHTDCPGLHGDHCLPGDADGSGEVDFSDFLLLQQNFGNGNASWQAGDFDGDGRVTFDDFVILANHFGAVS